MANKKISELPFISGSNISNTDLIPLVTYFSSVTGDTVHTFVGDLLSVSSSANTITYSTLITLISNSGLTVGSYYLISDYRTCYDQPDYDVNGTPITTGNYKQGPIEPLIVFATSTYTISNKAYQPLYPNDKITYDWNFTTTEVTGGDAYGRITERIDEFNNRTDYDHRNILFKRYKLFTIRSQQKLNGFVELQSDGTVLGTDTNFTGLSIGDVIYTDSNGSFYEITGITDNTTMNVSGDTISPFGCCSNFYKAIEETNGNGYFSIKRTNVKTSDFTEYTTFGDAISNDYAKNNYVGNYANNYQNVGLGVFLLANNVFLEGQYESNKFGDYCYNNTFGTDNQNNVWGDWCYNNVSTNDIDDNIIGHYFNNNLINTNLQSNYIQNNFEYNKLLAENGTSFRNNKISNNFINNTIYSEFSDNDIKTDFTNNIIGDYSNLDNFRFFANTVGNGFDSNIVRQDFLNNDIKDSFNKNTLNGEFSSNDISNFFNANTTGHEFRQNTIGNEFSQNLINDIFYSNKIGDYFTNNKISNEFFTNTINDYFTFNQYSNNNLIGWDVLSTVSARTYTNFNNVVGGGNLGNRILGKQFVMRVISTSQYFIFTFNQWSVAGVGGGFQYERQEIDVNGSPIGSSVVFNKQNNSTEIDVIIPGVLEITRGNNGGIYNVATEIGWSSPTSPDDTEWNSIYTQPNNGRRFAYNKIGNYFGSNIIDNDFGYGGGIPQGNLILDNFVGNSIGEFMYNNIIGNYFRYNTIGDNFENNTIKNYFNYNIISNNFENNQIGDYFGNNSKSASEYNIIGDYFINNQIGNYFGTNNIFSTGGNKIGVKNLIKYNTLKGIPLGINLTNGGTGYSDTTNVPTTGGLGSSLTVDIITDGLGVITGVTINNPGTYYATGDTITITTGNNDATFDITGITSFNIGDTITNGLGGSAEIVTDNGLDELTVNVIIGSYFFAGNTVDNGNGVNCVVTDFTITPDISLFRNNVIGNHFLGNQIGTGFSDNHISNFFGNDKSTDMSNIVLDNFSGNVIGNYFGIDVETPSVGEGGNIIRNNFMNNRIGESFTYNVTFDTSGQGYYDNVIGWGCNNNTIGDGFNSNRIGDLFQENNLNTNFAGNKIGYFFNSNEVDANATFNTIGDMSWFNTIGINFDSNQTGVSFFANEIGTDFAHNTIGNFVGQFFVAGNTFGNNVFDNYIGNHIYSNTISDNFGNNQIFNNFISNIVGSGFQYNITEYDVNGVDFSLATHVYNNYNCTIFANSASSLRLRYFDSLDNLVITNPNS